jgi:ABC-type spermidine/putrescine transport system permease subunit II
MTKSNWWAAFLSLFALVLLSAPLAVLFGYKWLAFDEPNRTFTCKGTSTCWAGETVNMLLASAFGAMAVICAGITVVIVIRWRRWRGARSRQPKEISAEL